MRLAFFFMQGVEGFGFHLRFLCLHPYAYASNGTHTTQSLACVLPLCHPDFVKSFYSIQEEHKAEYVCVFYIYFLIAQSQQCLWMYRWCPCTVDRTVKSICDNRSASYRNHFSKALRMMEIHVHAQSLHQPPTLFSPFKSCDKEKHLVVHTSLFTTGETK